MAVYLFPEFKAKGCGATVANTYRVTLASMTMSTFAISWAAPTAATYNPFVEMPGLSREQSAGTGAMAVGGGQARCSNFAFDTGIRMSTLFTDYNPFDTRWFVRVEIKVGASWEYLRDYMVMHDPDIDLVSPTDADTWLVSLELVDPLYLFEEISPALIMAELEHATYDIAPTAVSLTWMDAGSPQSANIGIVWQDDQVGEVEARNVSELRFFKLMDVLGAFHRCLGLTNAINDGGALDHDWVYEVRESGVDQNKGFEDLCVTSALYYNTTVYQQYWTYVDGDRFADHSWYNCGSALEMLKSILIPHGLSAEMLTDSGGDWYISVTQLLHSTARVLADTSWRRNAKYAPADRLLTGVVVQTSNDGMYIHGSSGDGADSLRCSFTAAARIRRGLRWINSAGNVDDLTALHSSLWALHGTVMCNVYGVTVASHGQTGGSSAIAQADWDDPAVGLLFAVAAAKYYYNPLGYASDPIGIHRPWMRRIEFTVAGIDRTTKPGEYMAYASKTWWILAVKWDLKGNSTTYIAETGEW